MPEATELCAPICAVAQRGNPKDEVAPGRMREGAKDTEYLSIGYKNEPIQLRALSIG